MNTIVEKYNKIKSNETFLYTNYFGLKDNFVNQLSENCENLIIDNTEKDSRKKKKQCINIK